MNAATFSPRWGATEEDWDRFVELVGPADLLPVVSNPSAEVSPRSTLRQPGKTPSIYNADRKVVGIRDWTRKVATAQEIAVWRSEPDYGLCVQTRRLTAIDIDVNDPLKALRCALSFARLLGLDPASMPVRRRENSGRLLLPVRVCGGTPRKQSVSVDGGVVELLGVGQQFVACGTHPSGARYIWAAGLPKAFLDEQ